jgi:cyanophycinase-like exopeptidase
VHLEGKITDSHFVARISIAGWTRAPYGIGIDEKTAVLMDADGTATVTGTFTDQYFQLFFPCARSTEIAIYS